MATVTNISAAADIPDVYTITIGGTWATNDTLTIKCGDRGVTIDLGASGSTTTSNIAAEVAAILVAESRRDGVGTGYSWSHGALEYGEFREIQNVSISGSVVTVEGPPGVPITITGSETSTSGTVTVANPQAATGKYFFDNAANWDTGSVPVDSDDIVFNESSLGVRYGFPSSVDPASVTVTAGFEGNDRWIGLPIWNRTDPNFPYQEYRARYLAFDDDVDETGSIEIGVGEGNGSPLINIDWPDKGTLVVVEVQKTAAPIPSLSKNSLNLKGAATNFGLYISGGDVALAPLDSDAGVVTHVATSSSVTSTPHLVIGPGASGSPALMELYGGTVDVYASLTVTELRINGALLRCYDGGIGGTNLNNFGSILAVASVGATNVLLGSGSVYDARQNLSAPTWTNTVMQSGAQLHDPQRQITLSNGIDLEGCGLQDVVIDRGKNITVTAATI